MCEIKVKTEWKIPHPGTAEWLTCESFQDAFDRWFEGHNIPRLVVDGKMEPFAVSHKRVEDYYANGGR